MHTKKLFLLPLLLMLVGALCACGAVPDGDVSKAERVIENNTLYSEDEISDAMTIVEQTFHQEFKGCKLLNLRYDEERSKQEAEYWLEEADEAIVLLSDFHVSANGGDGSLNQNSDYTDWSWILLRKNGGAWTLRTWGYG